MAGTHAGHARQVCGAKGFGQVRFDVREDAFQLFGFDSGGYIGFFGWIQSSSPITASIRVLRTNTASPINTNPLTNPSVIVSQ